jgi:hypothetical protein
MTDPPATDQPLPIAALVEDRRHALGLRPR